MHNRSCQGSIILGLGGGAGHEPGQAGYIGEGMLSAAVSGQVFASPSAKSVLAAIRAVATPAGCLLVVLNYTGARHSNFCADITCLLAERTWQQWRHYIQRLVLQLMCLIVLTESVANRKSQFK